MLKENAGLKAGESRAVNVTIDPEAVQNAEVNHCYCSVLLDTKTFNCHR